MRCRPPSPTAGGLDDVAAIAIAGQQHGMVVLDDAGRVIRPALLWNDTRSAPAALDLIAELGAAAHRRAHRLGAGRELHRDQAALAARRRAGERGAGRRRRAPARLADLAPARVRARQPRLRRARDRPLRRERHRATTTPSTGEYDRELLVAALGHDVILPRVLAPDRGFGRPATRLRPRCRRQRGRSPRPRCRPRRRRRVDRHEWHRVRCVGRRRRTTPRVPSPASPMRVATSCRWSPRSTLPACSTRSRHCSASTTTSSARSRSLRRAGRRRARPAAVLRGRAHAEPAGRDGDPDRHDHRVDDAGEPRPRRDRGHARRLWPTDSPRSRDLGVEAEAHPAHRWCGPERGRASDRGRRSSSFRSTCRPRASTSPRVPRARRRGC